MVPLTPSVPTFSQEWEYIWMTNLGSNGNNIHLEPLLTYTQHHRRPRSFKF